MLAARVVGLALELLLKTESEQDVSTVTTGDCTTVELWATQCLLADGSWGLAKTCVVPVLSGHQRLTLYIMKRLLVWVAGLGLAVKNAVVAKTRAEGTGHHDMIFKHTGTSPPYCKGFISTELKVSSVGKNGRKFMAAWAAEKGRCEEALVKVLDAKKTPFGATMLFLIGVADDEDLLMSEPPLLVRAQLLTLADDRSAKWGSILLDRGFVPVEPTPPPPKRARIGASWDEVRAVLASMEQDIDDDGVLWARLLDLFKAISPKKTVKNPGQKLETYEKHLSLAEGRDFKRRRYPPTQRGSEAVWLTRHAVKKIYMYEVSGSDGI